MKITQAEFIISAVGPAQYPEDGMPEIALAGRSNVGKSSLINRMIQRKNLARTSSQPGKTQQLNYYRINNEMYFVDVPGYGFARVSKTQRQAWGRMIENYLSDRETLRLVIQLIDLRHPPSKEDCMMHEWLRHYGVPICVVATKADKLSKNQRPKHMKQIRTSLGLTSDVPFIMFSSETGDGREELWDIILQHSQADDEIDEHEIEHDAAVVSDAQE
ncbi:ribosome biogenesis GTP-binding protein YihA/YsxC [Paenibacillus sp. 481]|uniref:ribosome biogenesis GTP-binding protein YihA/YsxC n=1 Tax=Paenibacillus sp. 481 TaxID=2835869 RepID=UPI001E29EE54|nr:ribosome biogenesis GTP-binding protein YihA/YsxC [Paenibacillus sp. 481]UHA74378.1 ribosome biogenesis GTP-binding protein YihA/YsxC [Paenibacillus sp. 481]